ncbi:phage tail assembly chaperone [Croceicoccus naphthovorans]|uniref:Phage tail assembly chaperone n=1 Tax=Croceicoccus naphthovorans TaxID=1348774 RepID=A0A0G3XFX1_9SPHN|nr:phage tail assembly chaperone [Croceicoccus naphthovorans]AKM09283.1 hypothetical protein AB433_03690 [Croceicoccus naphthovorans]
MNNDRPDSFTTDAARLCGQCALIMGWRPDEFWAATPAEIASIFNAFQAPKQNASVSRADLDRLMEQDHG